MQETLADSNYHVTVAVDDIPAASVPVVWHDNAYAVDGTVACAGIWSASVKSAQVAYQIRTTGNDGFGFQGTDDVSPDQAGNAIALIGSSSSLSQLPGRFCERPAFSRRSCSSCSRARSQGSGSTSARSMSPHRPVAAVQRHPRHLLRGSARGTGDPEPGQPGRAGPGGGSPAGCSTSITCLLASNI